MGLGSGICKKPIPDSAIQGSKRHRIQDPDLQHCFYIWVYCTVPEQRCVAFEVGDFDIGIGG
jgi:hypothetical protein